MIPGKGARAAAAAAAEPRELQLAAEGLVGLMLLPANGLASSSYGCVAIMSAYSSGTDGDREELVVAEDTDARQPSAMRTRHKVAL